MRFHVVIVRYAECRLPVLYNRLFNRGQMLDRVYSRSSDSVSLRSSNEIRNYFTPSPVHPNVNVIMKELLDVDAK